MNIIARKPRLETADDKAEVIMVERSGAAMPFVVATATPESLSHGEWFWGHYFATRDEALAHFNAR